MNTDSVQRAVIGRAAAGFHRARPAARIRVMIVDNHPVMRRGLAALLEEESDLTVCGAVESGPTTLDQIRHVAPEVVLVNVSLHSEEGLQLVQGIRALNLPVRVVVIASAVKPDQPGAWTGVGTIAFITDVNLPVRILAAIRRQGVAVDTPAPAGRRSALDPADREIVELIGSGVPSRAIAIRLHLSLGRIEACRRRIRSRLNFPTAVQLVHYCARAVEHAPAGSAGR